jgi:hypothetical protein
MTEDGLAVVLGGRTYGDDAMVRPAVTVVMRSGKQSIACADESSPPGRWPAEGVAMKTRRKFI